jgi:hypothetical protein
MISSLVIVYMVLAYQSVFGDINFTLLLDRLKAYYESSYFMFDSSDSYKFIDLHYLSSLILVAGCAIRGSLNRNLVWACRILFVAGFAVICSSVFIDCIDSIFFNSSFKGQVEMKQFLAPTFDDALYWSEPILISLGIAVLCQLVTSDMRFIFRADK